MEKNQKSLQIGIIGYGKMGRAVEEAVRKCGYTPGPVITKNNSAKEFASLQDCPVAIEFTNPDQAIGNIKKAADLGINIVVGTTGWESNMMQVREIVQNSSIGCLYSPNFSIGMHIFQKMVAYACRHFGAFTDFDVAAHETHHRQKKDLPSGTAKALSSVIIENFPAKKSPCYTTQPFTNAKEQLHFSSLRLGSVFGSHEVYFDSPEESVSLTHNAKSRFVFAQGAVLAASWLAGKKGLYCFDDFLNTYLQEQ